MSYQTAVIIGYSILIPAVIGLIRFRKIQKAYQPFLIYCLLDLLNHTLSMLLISYQGSNTINSNVFVLIESLLFVLLFRNWGTFTKKYNFYLVSIFIIAVWITDNLIWHRLTVVNSFFRIVYSFILIFLGIEQLNKLISTTRKNLLLNSCFLICCGIVIYYSYKAVLEVFYFFYFKASDSFYINIFIILIWINFILNLVYGWAALWIPKKQKFTLLP